jgi:Phage integrase family
VHLTPHQWRHTFACRLINCDVPQEVVRILLDHESSQMTAHYARITDQTVRRRWEQATKVNVKGERVSIDPDGPLAQAHGRRPATAWPRRPCRTATASCRCRTVARTPTPA